MLDLCSSVCSQVWNVSNRITFLVHHVTDHSTDALFRPGICYHYLFIVGFDCCECYSFTDWTTNRPMQLVEFVSKISFADLMQFIISTDHVALICCRILPVTVIVRLYNDSAVDDLTVPIGLHPFDTESSCFLPHFSVQVSIEVSRN